MWNGQVQIVAVDYERYVIVKFCYLELNKCKYVSCERFKWITKLTILGPPVFLKIDS